MITVLILIELLLWNNRFLSFPIKYVIVVSLPTNTVHFPCVFYFNSDHISFTFIIKCIWWHHTYTLYIFISDITLCVEWNLWVCSVTGIWSQIKLCIHDSVEFQAALLQAYVPKLTIRQILAIFYVPWKTN